MAAVAISRKRKKPINKIRVLFLLFCVVPPILDWLVFYVFTNLDAFTMAFKDRHGIWSWDNFIKVWGEVSNPESTTRLAFRNTLLTFAIQLGMMPFNVMVSYFLYKKIPFHKFYRHVFFIPAILSGIVVTMVFKNMIGTESFIAQWVQQIEGLDYVPELLSDSRYANIVVLLHMVWLGFPGDLVIWGGTFSRIPTEVLESGEIDGVTWWQEFTKIVVPLVWPTFALSLVLKLNSVLAASGEVFLLTNGDFGTITIPAWMQLEMLNNSGDAYSSNVYNYMAAFGLVLTVVGTAIALTVRKITDKMFPDVDY